MNPNSLQDFLTTTNVQIPVISFIINLLLAATLSFLLSRIYVKYADSLSNKRMFSRNFLMITMATMLIISIVKSSLALSLGLVGALSIVRFRAAIKEPEELGYLFLAISIGLGFGADQGVITIVAFIIISSVIAIRKSMLSKEEDNQNLHLTISSHNPHKIDLDQLVHTLKENCLSVNLKRFDEANETLDACFLVELGDFKQLNKTKSALQELNKSMRISFLDNKGVV